jgi:hypothetical protein
MNIINLEHLLRLNEEREVKVKITLEQAMNSQMERTSLPLFFL